MKKIIFYFTSLLFISVLISCKSVPQKQEVYIHPLALLNTDSSIYINVPVQNHNFLTAKILCAELPSVSEKNALSLAEHIDHLYAGLGTKQDRSKLQISADTKIPKIVQNMMLTKKNGWLEQVYKTENQSLYNYYCRSDTDFLMAIPSDNLLVCAKNITQLLEKHSQIPEIEQTVYADWITQESEDILFYITNPGQYLRNLLGQSVTIAITDVYGALKYLPSKKDEKTFSGLYELSFYLKLKDKRTMPAFRSMLALSFALSGGSVNQVDESTLHLSGVEVGTKQIEDLFTRDPITGKHFKVQGETIIKENKK